MVLVVRRLANAKVIKDNLILCNPSRYHHAAVLYTIGYSMCRHAVLLTAITRGGFSHNVVDHARLVLGARSSTRLAFTLAAGRALTTGSFLGIVSGLASTFLGIVSGLASTFLGIVSSLASTFLAECPPAAIANQR
ncbi:hypothetical protein Ae201684_014684 [Aphanomyces euteiches]|uniref:Uncharacterized protein n=1 Tax=Aphanomyces euteiches TaxID=100861 RepID=A0A6G0WJ54_9STRA|nr:hypothetical protein Ae201684_014684 [Aphanomyces euteiches]